MTSPTASEKAVGITLHTAAPNAATQAASGAALGVLVFRRDQPSAARLIPCKRVAAYCRVSTDTQQQASSLDTQMRSFRELIAARPGWNLAGIYADEGLSGTRAVNRVEFQRMIGDCEAGKIDYIVTKSISRFARNTMECLQYVRRLKDMGVYVYFDENHIDTGGTASEMLLSILAAVAQEESHSISENIKWGVRKRFQAGKPRWTRLYGYAKDENGEYKINAEQAKGVRRIFELYVSGASLPQIAKTLENERIPAVNGGKWWPTTLAKVLRNERYIGDVLMQKYLTIDYLSHKEVKNDQTVVPSYYVKDHHEAIVDRKTFDLAQRILQLKDLHQGCVQYPYNGFLVCPYCAEKMFRFSFDEYGHQHMWTCACKNMDLNCPPFAINEKYIDRIVKSAYEALNERELRRLASKRDGIAEAAEACLDWLGKCPRLNRVEYVFLDALVESITFNNWNEAVVSWKFGKESLVAVSYDKPSDVPLAEIACARYSSQVTRRVELARVCCEKTRPRNGYEYTHEARRIENV